MKRCSLVRAVPTRNVLNSQYVWYLGNISRKIWGKLSDFLKYFCMNARFDDVPPPSFGPCMNN